jgi:hypothetical protein
VNGERSGFFVIDMKRSHQMPEIAEAFFDLGGRVHLAPFITPHDLQKGLAAACLKGIASLAPREVWGRSTLAGGPPTPICWADPIPICCPYPTTDLPQGSLLVSTCGVRTLGHLCRVVADAFLGCRHRLCCARHNVVSKASGRSMNR